MRSCVCAYVEDMLVLGIVYTLQKTRCIQFRSFFFWVVRPFFWGWMQNVNNSRILLQIALLSG